MPKPVAEFWYAIQDQGHGILRFNEFHVDPYAVGDAWLVIGAERNLLVDTGSGLVPLAPLVESLSGKPVLAVASNGYFDHAGGWQGFAARACHPLEAPALADPGRENAEIATYLTPDCLSALPRPDFDVARYRMLGAEPSELLEDGETLDLGDRRLEVLHLPGRSPGGLGFWEAASGSLFTSDMLYDGDHGPAWPPDDPPAYLASLQRLRALPFSRVYPGHYGPLDRAQARAVIDRQAAELC
ncbi:MAG: MBL fold metallo-hydrolase [Rhodovibrionaceae bacterium]